MSDDVLMVARIGISMAISYIRSGRADEAEGILEATREQMDQEMDEEIASLENKLRGVT